MLPTLLQIGPLAVSTQGITLALAFLVAAFMIWRKGLEENFDAEPLMDAVVLVTIVALVWARIFFIIFAGSVSAWGKILNFFSYPGFSYFGAFFGGLIFLIIFANRKKWNFFKLADVFVFGLVPAQILVRVGNFLDGSFTGKTTNLFWAVKVPGKDLPVHPLSLYEIIFLIALLVLIKKLERQYRLFDWYKEKRGEAAEGFLFLTYMFLYSVFRFLLEFLKNSKLYWNGLAWEQWLAIVCLTTSLILFYNRSGRKAEDLLAPVAKLLQSLKRKKREKVEVIIPTVQTRRVVAKKPFHFKVGMDAKGK
jgi:phosphatidylglycerol:prolipoprotein diacylglycerol transferase